MRDGFVNLRYIIVFSSPKSMKQTDDSAVFPRGKIEHSVDCIKNLPDCNKQSGKFLMQLSRKMKQTGVCFIFPHGEIKVLSLCL